MQSHKLGFFLTKNKIKIKLNKSCPTSLERLTGGYTEFDFTVDEGKERLNPSRDKNQGKHRRRKVKKSCVTFPLCDSPAGASISLMSRINSGLSPVTLF